MTKPIDTAAIRVRREAATGSNWIRRNGQILLKLGSGDLLKIGGGFDSNDAEFVAHAPQDISDLLDDNDRLRAELTAEKARADEYKAVLDSLHDVNTDIDDDKILVYIPSNEIITAQAEGLREIQADRDRWKARAVSVGAGN